MGRRTSSATNATGDGHSVADSTVAGSESDPDRYFPVADMLDGSDPGKAYYQKYISELSQKCWSHYESSTGYKKGGHSIQTQTLYTGSLGPCCYLRYRLATSPSFEGDANDKFQLLNDALSSANAVLEKERATRNWDNSLFEQEETLEGKQKVTLLNGESVGAMAMKVAIIHNMLPMMKHPDVNTDDLEMGELLSGIQDSINNLLGFATKYILSEALSQNECEIFQGRSGYLKAIKFVRSEIGDKNFGKQIVIEILEQVLEEGIELGQEKMLLYKYKQKCHLGSLHGVAGILHTLLDFSEEVEGINPESWKYIESTVTKMDDSWCLKSGNLAPTLKSCLPNGAPKRTDKCVQFCTGSPGHALLLTQMYRKSQERDQDSDPANDEYLHRAGEVAEKVVLPRGLLTKGVGLCHGISGNAFVFLSIFREMAKVDMDDAKQWLEYAHGYANFAIDVLDELESVPTHPFSLYEGLGGLICLLLGLVENADGNSNFNAKFPLFEF